MNPLLIFFFLYLLSSEKNSFGSGDTFKMELALDNMNKVVNMAQKINGLNKTATSFNQIPSLPSPASNPNAGSQPSSSAPDLGELMQTMGPILQMLSKGDK
ncbi:MAG: hypothetical protein PHW03_04150 [Eubacteriales bacterium]|nr:hypothetical protein [Eubacteriales bacterium]MDD4389973.1 hypothetical protein [Eubacteriales bacterium]